MDEYDDYTYGENPVDDMWTDYDYHVNTGELPYVEDEPETDDFDDWD